MAVEYKCDICKAEVLQKDRERIQLFGMSELCGHCKYGLKLAIDLMRVGPFVSHIDELHKRVFNKAT